MTADELLLLWLISELMAQDIQQNYKAVSGSPPSTGINPRILTAPHYEVQWLPKRWLRLWARKHWVMKHIITITIIIGVRTQAASRAPRVPLCQHPLPQQLAPHRLSTAISKASQTFVSLRCFCSKILKMSWQQRARTCLCSLFCRGDARLLPEERHTQC